jgi:hypothetical protein
MDAHEAVAEARQRAQRALSRAHLETDPKGKMRWSNVAGTWLKVVDAIERGLRKDRPTLES